MGNTEQSISDLVKNTPNDMELGKKVREYYWHTIATNYITIPISEKDLYGCDIITWCYFS